MKGSSAFSRSDSLVCPLCEVDQLRPSGNDSAQCASCAGLVSGAMLVTLRRISALPDALGKHACEECGRPEMRLLPDETYHCPGCGSEVLPIDAPSTRHEGGNDMPVMPAEAFLTIPFSLFTAHQALPWLMLTVALGLSALIGCHSLPRSWRRVRKISPEQVLDHTPSEEPVGPRMLCLRIVERDVVRDCVKVL